MAEESVEYSVVIPVFNEESNIKECYRRLVGVLLETKKPFEIIFINDGSSDHTEAILSILCEKDYRVRLVNLSRNFGQQVAITAGIDLSRGRATILMDGDLQDPPELIPAMIAKWKSGADVVYAKRKERHGETWFKKATSKLFYSFLSFVAEIHIPRDVGDFRLIDEKVKFELLKLREHNRFMRGLISWVGFKQDVVEFDREERHAGQPKYTINKLINLSLDAIISFSTKPLKLAVYLGLLTSFGALCYLCIVLYKGLFTHSTVNGWASIMSIILFLNGIILLFLGILGEYVGRIYSETKNRPLYIIRSIKNQDVEINGKTTKDCIHHRATGAPKDL